MSSSENDSANDIKQPPRLSRRRRWMFRLGAILIGLSPFLLLEVVFRVADIGRQRELGDPYIGFSAIHPLFELNAAGDCYEVAASRQEFFRPDRFLASKPADEFRVFCLGGSTVQGRPFAIETSFTTWLELSLQAAAPNTEWRVVNCGGVSYASYRLAPIMEEILAYEPDLIILYTGHNEFLEDRTYKDVRDAPSFVAWAHSTLSNFRIYNVARSAWLKVTSSHSTSMNTEQLPAEVTAELDFEKGLDIYRRDDNRRDKVVKHFAFNIARMINMAQQAKVPLLLVNPTCNLRDCGPFKSEHGDGVNDDVQSQVADRLSRVRQLISSDPQSALSLAEEAVAFDDRYATSHYLKGRCLDDLRRFDEARAAYLRAKDEDVCPLRVIEPMTAELRRIASDTSTPLIDVRAVFREASPQQITGDEWLLDHVHPTIDGHQEIADLIVSEMAEMRFVAPSPGWERERERRYAQHLSTLDTVYFQRGRQRLEGLRRWTRGESTLPRRD